MNGTNVGNALRLCAGETASTGTGSWRDTGEYFHIDRIYVTKVDPIIEPPNNPPHVWISYPDDGDTFTAGSNITIQSSAVDTDGNVTGVEFYNGTTLLGSGTPPTVQNDIVNTAATATIHGATATYNSSQNAIISWTNMADWVSWTPTVARTGTFEVWVNYSCQNSSAGSTYRVEVGDQIVQGTVTGTGTDWTNYDSVSLGTVDITQTGTIDLNVVPEDKPGAAVMNLRDVTLIPQELDTCYQYTWTNVSAGTYTLTTKATDDDDANTVSEPIVITVQP